MVDTLLNRSMHTSDYVAYWSEVASSALLGRTGAKAVTVTIVDSHASSIRRSATAMVPLCAASASLREQEFGLFKDAKPNQKQCVKICRCS